MASWQRSAECLSLEKDGEPGSTLEEARRNLGAVRRAATGVKVVASGGRSQGHWFKLVVDDLVPLERVDHDDGQADLNASHRQAFPLRMASALVIRQERSRSLRSPPGAGP